MDNGYLGAAIIAVLIVAAKSIHEYIKAKGPRKIDWKAVTPSEREWLLSLTESQRLHAFRMLIREGWSPGHANNHKSAYKPAIQRIRDAAARGDTTIDLSSDQLTSLPPEIVERKKMSFEQAKHILEKALVGNCYETIRVGDVWCLYFWEPQCCLVAQDIASVEEIALNELLKKAVPPILDADYAEQVAKSAVVMGNWKREIVEIGLETNGSLKVTFDNNRQIILTTSTDVVDWQWCLNKSGEGPYSDYIVACFWANSIDVAEGNLR